MWIGSAETLDSTHIPALEPNTEDDRCNANKTIALAHVEFEGLGSLAKSLEPANYAVEVVNACTTDLRAIDLKSDLLIVLGDPIDVYEHVEYDSVRGTRKPSL